MPAFPRRALATNSAFITHRSPTAFAPGRRTTFQSPITRCQPLAANPLQIFAAPSAGAASPPQAWGNTPQNAPSTIPPVPISCQSVTQSHRFLKLCGLARAFMKNGPSQKPGLRDPRERTGQAACSFVRTKDRKPKFRTGTSLPRRTQQEQQEIIRSIAADKPLPNEHRIDGRASEVWAVRARG